MSKVIVVGGGAAGMMAAIAAARKGHSVLLLEKNEKLGKKLFITGKGRCNLTNACDTNELFTNIITNHKFLYSAVYGFDNWMTYSFFEDLGVHLKIERGNRVFPESDHSSDVIRGLEQELKRLKVQLRLRTVVTALCAEQGAVTGVKVKSFCRDGKDGKNGKQKSETLSADAVILTTGGCSYASTGSTGDGYSFAERLGHTLSVPEPSLVPFVMQEQWCKDLMGLTLKNIAIQVKNGKKTIYEGFGELLFTHFGVSGPLVLTASTRLKGYLEEYDFRAEDRGKLQDTIRQQDMMLKQPLDLFVDLKPALSEEQLDERLQKDFFRYQNRQLQNAMDDLLPKKLIPIVISLSGIPADKKVNILTKEERLTLVHTLKKMPMHILGCRGFQEAIITRGGINVKEINPQTMESKLVSGLYIAGELLDTDAVTGGFNLQIAWSTGYAAGNAIE